MILQLGFKFSTVNSFVLKKLYKEEGSFSSDEGHAISYQENCGLP